MSDMKVYVKVSNVISTWRMINTLTNCIHFRNVKSKQTMHQSSTTQRSRCGPGQHHLH